MITKLVDCKQHKDHEDWKKMEFEGCIPCQIIRCNSADHVVAAVSRVKFKEEGIGDADSHLKFILDALAQYESGLEKIGMRVFYKGEKRNGPKGGQMKKWDVKVTYPGEIGFIFDEAIFKTAEGLGGSRVGTGFTISTGIRDLQIEFKEDKAAKRFVEYIHTKYKVDAKIKSPLTIKVKLKRREDNASQ